EAKRIEIISGDMQSGDEVSVDEEIRIENGAGFSVTGGIVRTKDFDNQGNLEFADGEIQIQGGIFDYSDSLADFVLAGDGADDRPLLRLTGGAETSGINTLTIGETGAGTLKLEDSSVSTDSGLAVESSGRLEGRGTIEGDVDARGASTVKPGDPTGTMRVEGNLDVAGTDDEKAVLDIEIKAGDHNSGKIHVTQTASLENAEVGIKDISGGAVTDGMVYEFLYAEDSLSWDDLEDADFVSRSPLYGFTPSVDTNSASFTARRLTDYSGHARTGNQKSIANALASARKNQELTGITPGWESLLEDIVENRAKSADMRRALDQMSPEPYQAALRSAAGQAYRMTRRTMDGARQSRLTLASKGGAGLDAMLQSALASSGSDPVAMGQAMYAAAESGNSAGRSGIDYEEMGTSAADSPWRAFYGAYRRRGDMDEASQRAGYELSENGYYLGMERETGRNWVAGGSIGYVYTSADFREGRGGLSMKSLRLGPHATWTGEKFTVDSAISFGAHANRQSRKMTLPEAKEAKARFNIFDGSIYTEARLNRNPEHNWHFIPVVSMHYTWQYREQYDERGAGDANLAFEDDSAQSLEGLAGLIVSREYSGHGFVVLPEIYGMWGMEMLDSDLDIKAEFENAPGSGCSVTSQGPGRSRGVVGIGVSVLFGGYNVAFARYEREFSGAGDLDAYSAGVKWNF
ncbi:MAG: autotransporter outer membrane beta-barrel domain-containing protein, partial [Desulfosalsimonas sp.]